MSRKRQDPQGESAFSKVMRFAESRFLTDHRSHRPQQRAPRDLSRGARLRYSWCYVPLSAAAGTQEDASKDDQPQPVVVKKLTDAIAVHIVLLPFEFRKVRRPLCPSAAEHSLLCAARCHRVAVSKHFAPCRVASDRTRSIGRTVHHASCISLGASSAVCRPSVIILCRGRRCVRAFGRFSSCLAECGRWQVSASLRAVAL